MNLSGYRRDRPDGRVSAVVGNWPTTGRLRPTIGALHTPVAGSCTRSQRQGRWPRTLPPSGSAGYLRRRGAGRHRDSSRPRLWREDDTELFEHLAAAPGGSIETAYWLRPRREVRSGNIAVSLHCRCDGLPFDLGFHFEVNDPDGRSTGPGAEEGRAASSLTVELLLVSEGSAGAAGLHLTAERLKGTGADVAAIDAVL